MVGSTPLSCVYTACVVPQGFCEAETKLREESDVQGTKGNERQNQIWTADVQVYGSKTSVYSMTSK